MAFLKKLAFWKHEPEESDFELPPSEPKKSFPSKFPQMESAPEPSFPAAFMPQSPAAPVQSESNNAELRVISAKLDTVKAMLDVLNQRLERLEGRKNEEVKWR